MSAHDYWMEREEQEMLAAGARGIRLDELSPRQSQRTRAYDRARRLLADGWATAQVARWLGLTHQTIVSARDAASGLLEHKSTTDGVGSTTDGQGHHHIPGQGLSRRLDAD